jgi:hypothetical protein
VTQGGTDVQTIASTLVTVLVAMSAAMLMIHAGVAKRRLAWRTRRTSRIDQRRR